MEMFAVVIKDDFLYMHVHDYKGPIAVFHLEYDAWDWIINGDEKRYDPRTLKVVKFNVELIGPVK